jgi:hypothetical protein
MMNTVMRVLIASNARSMSIARSAMMKSNGGSQLQAPSATSCFAKSAKLISLTIPVDAPTDVAITVTICIARRVALPLQGTGAG